METRWIKRISFILAAAMLLTLLPVSALAEEASPSQNTTAPIIDTPANTPAEEHVVALTAADGGRVSGGGVYVDGEEVTVTAHPSDDYEFTGWYDDAQLISIAPVYTFTASQSVSYQAAFSVAAETTFALTVGGTEKYTVTDKDGKELTASAIPANAAVTLTYTGPEGTFLYWVNGSGNILSTDSVYTFTMVRDTTIVAKYTESAPTVSRVVFRNGYSQIMEDFTEGSVSLPAGPTKMGYTFDYWYYFKDGEPTILTESNLDTFNKGLSPTDHPTRIDVLPFYSENGAKYTINISYQTADGDELETQPNPKTQTVKVGVKTNTGDAPATIGKLTFSYWKELVGENNSRIVSYDRNYSVLRAQSCTVNLVAVYSDTEIDPEPIVNIIQTYASMSGEKYVVSNTMQYYLPEGYDLVQAGIEYYTSTNETVRRSIDSNTTRRGLFTFNARLSNPSTTLNARGFIIYKNEAGVQDPQYSDLVSKSYYDLSGTASVKVEDGKKLTASDATIQSAASTENAAPAATATIPQGVRLDNDAIENGTVSLTVSVTPKDEPSEGDNAVSVGTIQAGMGGTAEITYYDVSVSGISEENEEKIIVHLIGALAPNVANVQVYHEQTPMTRVYTEEALTETEGTEPFYYDQQTGDVYLCIANFSMFTFAYKSYIKFPNVDKYLYRVGNKNAVLLSTLFKNTDDIATVTITPSSDTPNAGGSYENENKKCSFTGTGVVNVTATLTNDDTITLPLEVVDATNATNAMDATSNNVVLLNNVSVGGSEDIKINNGYALYGNGFTINCTGDGNTNGSSGLGTGYILIENSGWLDNVKVIAPDFAKAYMYVNTSLLDSGVKEDDNKVSDNHYAYQLSAIRASGDNVVISNSYIYGARNNILADGNLLLDNCTLSNGALSNIHMNSQGGSLSLNNVSTIQYRRSFNYQLTGQSAKKADVIGFGILMGPTPDSSVTVSNNPVLSIAGDFTQYNWVCENDENITSSKVAKNIISAAVSKENYQHTLNGITYVNPGVVYLNSATATINDSRDNHGYVKDNVSITGVSGQVYAPAKNSAQVELKDSSYVYQSDCQGIALPALTYSDLSDDRTFVQSAGLEYSFTVSLAAGEQYEFDFDKLSVLLSGNPVSYVLKDNDGNVVESNSKIVLNTAGTSRYTIELTGSSQYNAEGSMQSVEAKTYKLSLALVASVAALPAPTKISDPSGTVYKMTASNSTSSNWTMAAAPLDGLRINYWSTDKNREVELDFSNVSIKKTTNNTLKLTGSDWTLEMESSAIKDGKTNIWVIADGTLYVTASTSDRVSTDTKSRKSTIKYTFKDNCGHDPLEFSKIFSCSKPANGDTLYYHDTLVGNSPSLTTTFDSCLASGTLITMADGTQKPIEDIRVGDMVMTWSFWRGRYEPQPVLLFWDHGDSDYEVLSLQFSDGTKLRMIDEHSFFDADINDYVYITPDNVDEYYGHRFIKYEDAEEISYVTLEASETVTEYSGCYSIRTAYNENCISDGVLSVTPRNYLYFTLDNTMTYDAAVMDSDIAQYGLFTYEEWADYCTPAEFEMVNAKYYKVLIGKGIITMDELLRQILEAPR